jgi:Cys-rich repeat protein
VFQSFVGSLALMLLTLAALSGCSKGKCEPCTQDSDCASGLVCHPEVKVCTARDKPSCPVECLKSKKCREDGLCTLKGNKCVIGEDDCRQSAQCTDRGKCTRKDLGAIGMCVSISPEDCEKSTFCRTKGHCSVDRKSRLCRALSDADCERAEICTVHKKCKANSKGDCVAAAP